jgi:glycosyltransferase involved in cell wall biosynthesis
MERMNALDRFFLRAHLLSAVTAPSQGLAGAVGGATVMPNALPASLADGVLACHTPPDPPTFGVVGRLNPEKGIGHFLDAIGELPAAWRFVVVGDGPMRPVLEAHPAARRVDWLGFREDARTIMRGFTALVIPSLTEGVPIALLEAIAQGVPVVASAVGGIPEVLEDGRHARLVPAADASALARAMREVAGDAAAARGWAREARDRFLADHTSARVGDTLEALYRGLAGGAR